MAVDGSDEGGGGGGGTALSSLSGSDAEEEESLEVFGEEDLDPLAHQLHALHLHWGQCLDS